MFFWENPCGALKDGATMWMDGPAVCIDQLVGGFMPQAIAALGALVDPRMVELFWVGGLVVQCILRELNWVSFLMVMYTCQVRIKCNTLEVSIWQRFVSAWYVYLGGKHISHHITLLMALVQIVQNMGIQLFISQSHGRISRMFLHQDG